MSVVYNILVAVHLLGMAAIVGGYLSVLKAPRISEVMVWGARIQLLSGLVIVGLGEAVDSLGKDYDHAKIGVKLLITLIIVAVAEIGGLARSAARATRTSRTSWASWASSTP